jgi:Xaa-Pro aminopeptidase
MEAEFRRVGSIRNGYPSIVASGVNACILHYVTNRRQMQDGDLILIDAGAEVDYYSADITRTWPVSGTLTPEQASVYAIVLEAQRRAIEAVEPGATVRSVHDTALRVLVDGLIDIGALDGNADDAIEERTFTPYYMHGTSHWLGLDVHDAGVYKEDDEPLKLREGMVLTVEPGLYFGSQAEGAPDRLKGIGVRIEDDILVTADGHRNLSENIPKHAA